MEVSSSPGEGLAMELSASDMIVGYACVAFTALVVGGLAGCTFGRMLARWYYGE